MCFSLLWFWRRENWLRSFPCICTNLILKAFQWRCSGHPQLERSFRHKRVLLERLLESSALGTAFGINLNVYKKVLGDTEACACSKLEEISNFYDEFCIISHFCGKLRNVTLALYSLHVSLVDRSEMTQCRNSELCIILSLSVTIVCPTFIHSHMSFTRFIINKNTLFALYISKNKSKTNPGICWDTRSRLV